MSETMGVIHPPFIDKATEILESITDGNVMVLKGHLLLEELLYAAI